MAEDRGVQGTSEVQPEDEVALHDLSDELLVQVFIRINHPPKIAQCTRLSRRFRSVLSDDGLWRDLLLQATRGKQPPRNGVTLGPSGPGDSYRHAYIRIMYDASRLEITRDELVNSTWKFYFVSDMYLFHASPEQAAQRAGAMGNQGHTATFSERGIFASNVPGAPSRRTPTRWQLLARSESSDPPGCEASCASSPPACRIGSAALSQQGEGRMSDASSDACVDSEAMMACRGMDEHGTGAPAQEGGERGAENGGVERRRHVCATAAESRLEAGVQNRGSEQGGGGGEAATPAIVAADPWGPQRQVGEAGPIEMGEVEAVQQQSPSASSPRGLSGLDGSGPGSPLALPLRSPSGDFALLASTDCGSFVQVLGLDGSPPAPCVGPALIAWPCRLGHTRCSGCLAREIGDGASQTSL